MQPFNLTPTDSVHLRWLEDYLFPLFPQREFLACKVLELGCGKGGLIRHLGSLGLKSGLGLDILILSQFIDGSVSLDHVDFNQPEWSSKLSSDWDICLAFDILEHVDNPWEFLLHCKRLLNKNGTLVLTTPNTLSWQRVLCSSGWSGATDPQHKFLFHPYSLKFLLERAGFKVLKIRAPIRKLAWMSSFIPDIGAQMICVASAHQ